MMNINRYAGRKFWADLACPDALDEGYFVDENGTDDIKLSSAHL